MICQADNRLLNMWIRINVAMNDPHYKVWLSSFNLFLRSISAYKHKMISPHTHQTIHRYELCKTRVTFACSECSGVYRSLTHKYTIYTVCLMNVSYWTELNQHWSDCLLNIDAIGLLAKLPLMRFVPVPASLKKILMSIYGSQQWIKIRLFVLFTNFCFVMFS